LSFNRATIIYIDFEILVYEREFFVKKLKAIKACAGNEAYEYFHEHIRPLPKTKDGHWDFETKEFHNNDVDAFRHAYVSGVFTKTFTEAGANVLGQLNELEGDYKRNQRPEEKNMDLWNNAIGRKYGKIAASYKELAKLIQIALKNNELIITIDQKKDNRTYKGSDYTQTIDPNKPVIVVEENETGRNGWFLDLLKGMLLSREAFVQEIESGNYPGYLVSDINAIATPMSKPDGSMANNLG
jgi:hypothetical protein